MSPDHAMLVYIVKYEYSCFATTIENIGPNLFFQKQYADPDINTFDYLYQRRFTWKKIQLTNMDDIKYLLSIPGPTGKPQQIIHNNQTIYIKELLNRHPDTSA